MNGDAQTLCPHCHARFNVSEQQLRSAEGKVRCGNCLRVFDGYTGEPEFVAPKFDLDEPKNPLAHIELAPMDSAEMPNLRRRPPLGLLLLVMVLSLVLAGQWTLQRLRQQPLLGSALSVKQLVVRAHPQRHHVLQVNAILYNAAERAIPYPAMFLYFDNRYGERQAERLLMPADYLKGELTQATGIPARARVQVSLLLEDPGRGAVNYGLALQSVKVFPN